MFNEKNNKSLLENRANYSILPVVRRLKEFKFSVIEYCDEASDNRDYVIFEECDEIIDLLSVLNRDADNFSIMISNKNDEMNYGVFFDNKNSGMAEYFTKIVYGFLQEEIRPKSKEREFLSRINERLKKSIKGELSYSVNLNDEYFEYMNKTGKTNIITVRSRIGNDMDEFARIFAKSTNLKKIQNDNDYNDSNNFIESSIDRKTAIINLDKSNANKIVDVIDFGNELMKHLNDVKKNKEIEQEYGG